VCVCVAVCVCVGECVCVGVCMCRCVYDISRAKADLFHNLKLDKIKNTKECELGKAGNIESASFTIP